MIFIDIQINSGSIIREFQRFHGFNEWYQVVFTLHFDYSLISANNFNLSKTKFPIVKRVLFLLSRKRSINFHCYCQVSDWSIIENVLLNELILPFGNNIYFWDRFYVVVSSWLFSYFGLNFQEFVFIESYLSAKRCGCNFYLDFLSTISGNIKLRS